MVTFNTTATIADQAAVTEADEIAWITEHDNSGEPWADYVCAARHFAVYGYWPDGEAPPANLQDYPPHIALWLGKQSYQGYWQEARMNMVRHKAMMLTKSIDLPTEEAYPGHAEWVQRESQRKNKKQIEAALRDQKASQHRRHLLQQIRRELALWANTKGGIGIQQQRAAKELSNRLTELESLPDISAADFVAVVVPNAIANLIPQNAVAELEPIRVSIPDVDALLQEITTTPKDKPLPIAVSPLGAEVLAVRRRSRF